MMFDSNRELVASWAKAWSRQAAYACLLLCFGLFPIAHFSILGWPLYWSETMLLLSLALTAVLDWPWFINRLTAILSGERRFFFFVGLFSLGILLSYFLNLHSFSGWGEIKSFYLLPILFLVAILVWGESHTELRHLALAWLLGILGASAASLVAALLGWYLYDGRLAGLYQSPNYLAMLIAPGVLLALSLSFSWRKGSAERFLPLFSLILIVPVLWLTRSYAAWFALSSALIAYFAMGRKIISLSKWSMIFLALILSLLLFQESGSEKWHSLVSLDERSSLSSRLMIWRSAAHMTADFFPWGIGTGRFQEVYLDYQRFYPPYLEWAVPTPHNLYLHFLLEGGVLSLVGWLGCVGWVLLRAHRSRTAFHRPDGGGSDFLALSIALLIFYLVYGLVDTPYMKNDLTLAVWGSLGFVLTASRIKA